MESLFGITGKDFVLTAFSTSVVRSIVVMKYNEDKSRRLNDHTLMLYTGEPGDAVHFAEYIQANIKLYGIQHNIELGPKAAATFTRKELANNLRSRKPYNVNLLIAGYDKKTGPALYWLDYFASMMSLPYAAQGYGAFFCLSLMDRYHRPDLTEEEAIALMKKCVHELQIRFMVNMPEFVFKIVDKNGVRDPGSFTFMPQENRDEQHNKKYYNGNNIVASKMADSFMHHLQNITMNWQPPKWIVHVACSTYQTLEKQNYVHAAVIISCKSRKSDPLLMGTPEEDSDLQFCFGLHCSLFVTGDQSGTAHLGWFQKNSQFQSGEDPNKMPFTGKNVFQALLCFLRDNGFKNLYLHADPPLEIANSEERSYVFWETDQGEPMKASVMADLYIRWANEIGIIGERMSNVDLAPLLPLDEFWPTDDLTEPGQGDPWIRIQRVPERIRELKEKNEQPSSGDFLLSFAINSDEYLPDLPPTKSRHAIFGDHPPVAPSHRLFLCRKTYDPSQFVFRDYINTMRTGCHGLVEIWKCNK